MTLINGSRVIPQDSLRVDPTQPDLPCAPGRKCPQPTIPIPAIDGDIIKCGATILKDCKISGSVVIPTQWGTFRVPVPDCKVSGSGFCRGLIEDIGSLRPPLISDQNTYPLLL
jgi:hypothetical protein